MQLEIDIVIVQVSLPFSASLVSPLDCQTLSTVTTRLNQDLPVKTPTRTSSGLKNYGQLQPDRGRPLTAGFDYRKPFEPDTAHPTISPKDS